MERGKEEGKPDERYILECGNRGRRGNSELSIALN